MNLVFEAFNHAALQPNKGSVLTIFRIWLC